MLVKSRVKTNYLIIVNEEGKRVAKKYARMAYSPKAAAKIAIHAYVADRKSSGCMKTHVVVVSSANSKRYTYNITSTVVVQHDIVKVKNND